MCPDVCAARVMLNLSIFLLLHDKMMFSLSKTIAIVVTILKAKQRRGANNGDDDAQTHNETPANQWCVIKSLMMREANKNEAKVCVCALWKHTDNVPKRKRFEIIIISESPSIRDIGILT